MVYIQDIETQLILYKIEYKTFLSSSYFVGGKTEQKALSIVMVAAFDVMTTFCALFSNL